MAQPHSPFASALPATRRAQTFLDPMQAQLLSQQGQIPQQISGLERQIGRAEARGNQPMPGAMNTAGGWTTAPHALAFIGRAAKNIGSARNVRKLEKSLRAKEQDLADYNRDVTRAKMETEAKRNQEDENFRYKQLEEQSEYRSALQESTVANRALIDSRARDRAEAIERRHNETQERLATNEQTRINEKIDTQVRKLGTDNAEYTDIGLAISDFADLYAPYAEPGTDIPGTGYLEGAPGVVGSAVRIGKDFLRGDKAGQQLNAARRGFINPIMREDAGTAQTYTETRNVLMELGASGWEDEDVFRDAWPRVVAAYNKDMERLRATYPPEVVARYEEQYQGKQSPLSLLSPTGQRPTGPGGDLGHGSGDVPGQGGFRSPGGHQYTVE